MHFWDVAFQTEAPVLEGLSDGELHEETEQHQAEDPRTVTETQSCYVIIPSPIPMQLQVTSNKCSYRQQLSIVMHKHALQRYNSCVPSILVASYPGLPSQLFSQPFFHGCENSCEGRPGYEASILTAIMKVSEPEWSDPQILNLRQAYNSCSSSDENERSAG